MRHTVFWTVGLSSGETIAEGTGDFRETEGALSPWQRLLSYLSERNLEITSLSLYTRDGKRWNLPSAGKNPRFAELATAPKPFDFRMFRKAAGDVSKGGNMEIDDLYTVAEAIFEDGGILQIWVCNESHKSWSLIR